MPYVNELDVALRAYVPAYEQVGARLPDVITNISAARQATGLTWEPATEPQYRIRRLGPGMESAEIVAGLKYVTRGEGGPVLGSVKARYQLFGNGELFEVAEALGLAATDEGHEVRFLAGGETDGGRKVYLLADLGTVDIPGDPSPHNRFVTLLSSHNGTGALKVLGTDFRFFCTNALSAVEMAAAASGAAFSFNHTTRVAKRLADARQAITAAVLQTDAIAERTREMLATRVSPAHARGYLSEFALATVIAKADPHRERYAAASPLRQRAVDAVEQELRTVWQSPTCDGIRDTAYGAFAAVVEYLDNRRPAKTAETRFTRTMLAVEPGKKRAYDLARRMF